jgi:integrase
MIELELVEKNPADHIKKINTTSEKNAVFTESQLDEILEYMKSTNPNLYKFSIFLLYTLSRPKEVVNIKIEHIDLKNRRIYFPAENVKTNVQQYKPIYDVLYQVIESMNLEKYPKHFKIFSASGIPSEKGTSRDYFTDKFEKVKKHFGLSKNHTMYGFKHTIVTKLMNAGHKHLDVMQLTGHKTIKAFEEYLRNYTIENQADLGGAIDNITNR